MNTNDSVDSVEQLGTVEEISPNELRVFMNEELVKVCEKHREGKDIVMLMGWDVDFCGNIEIREYIGVDSQIIYDGGDLVEACRIYNQA